MASKIKLGTMHNVKVNDEAYFYIQRLIIENLEAGKKNAVDGIASALILANKHNKETKNG